jgi:hypothetical protein
MREKRTQVWVDRFQTHLFVRVFFYFIVYQFAAWALVLLERSGYRALEAILGPEAAGYFIVVPVGVSLVVSMLFAYDALKLAHRLVGPLHRFRKTIQDVTEGGEVSLIKLRDGDLLVDMKDDLNAMLNVLAERHAVTIKTTQGESAAKDQVHPQGV